MTKKVSIQVWETKKHVKPWTWRMRANNGAVVANAAETFDSYSNSKRAALFVGALLGAEVWINAPDALDKKMVLLKAVEDQEPSS